MDIYLSEDVISGEGDPLMWWKMHGKRFPLMSEMARKYLCIPSTSTPLERVFSTAGNVVNNLRTLLKPEGNMLVFLSNNL